VLPGVWLLFSIALIGSALTSHMSREVAAAWYTEIMLTGVVLPLLLVTWCSRLELSEAGITHHQCTYRIESTWENVAALTLGPGPEGLLLRQRGGAGWFLRYSLEMLRIFGVANAFGGQALAEGRFIALAPFMAHWRKGPLRDDLRRMAPHLFAAERQRNR
jgi:hypothetical protein